MTEKCLESREIEKGRVEASRAAREERATERGTRVRERERERERESKENTGGGCCRFLRANANELPQLEFLVGPRRDDPEDSVRARKTSWGLHLAPNVQQQKLSERGREGEVEHLASL